MKINQTKVIPKVSSWHTSQQRSYSSLSQGNSEELFTKPMDPWFVTGFTDAEGCFYCSVIKDSKSPAGWRAKAGVFQIKLHVKDLSLLISS